MKVTIDSNTHKEWLRSAASMRLEGLSGFIYRMTQTYDLDDDMRPVAMAICCLGAYNAVQYEMRDHVKPEDRARTMWQLIEAFTSSSAPKRMLMFESILYPSRKDEYLGVPESVKEWLIVQANGILSTNNGQLPHDTVLHLEAIARGELPWGLQVTDEKSMT